MVNRARKAQLAQQKFESNVTKRGSAALKLQEKDDGPAIGPWLVGMLVFLVVGSSVFQLLKVALSGGNS
ncbi:Stress-associated endoplasmic reticulum protein 2 [Porphyridium purpureum]|uniref:Stress-associated endoplasmic reticulum protein 2 n=1 Tax=Porphyridium purpureum TaxID=35688 RepID=A0A5J4Z2E2_PORPP|nr:Stress-associated endoplasmic reticulum protein 2 [Porphyridium purpureum]|eukprot:POR7994..scf295_1